MRRNPLPSLDLLLVVEQALSKQQADALIAVVRSAELGPAAGIDLLVITRQSAAVRSPGDPARELLVGRWPGPGGELEIEGPEDHVSDLWPELSEARANGRALVGPEPRQVIGRVPPAQVTANSLLHLHRWLGLTDDSRNAVFMVVTACRMWRFGLTGDHVSKSAAALWALDRDASLTGVRSALAVLSSPQQVTIPAGDVEQVLLRALADLEGHAPQ